MKSVLADFEIDVGRIEAFTDATAAIGIAQREGVGRTRHIDTGLLWIQQREAKGDIKVGIVKG